MTVDPTLEARVAKLERENDALKERARRLERAVELLTEGAPDDAYRALRGADV